MIYTTQKGEAFDLEKDFSSPERHILQKLLLWKDMVAIHSTVLPSSCSTMAI